jgi:predicted phosphodiesterase
MQEAPKIIALLCADVHLSHNPPIWRSAEPDWYAAMQRPLLQIKQLSKKLNCNTILCAGDIFHKAICNSELINFAIENLPVMYAVPGQHDMPMHNYEDMEKSAFYTLVKAGIIKEICKDEPLKIDNGVFVHGFGWQNKIKDIPKSDIKNIALVHKYVWIKNKSYTTAPKENHLKHISPFLNKYDVAVFGDNHIQFKCNYKNTTVLNCGSLMRRHKDQENHMPKIGILYSDMTVKTVALDTSKDLYLTTQAQEQTNDTFDVHSFISEMSALTSNPNFFDFSEILYNYFIKNKTPKTIQNIIMENLNG